jgi:hypothetical protein
MKHLPFQSYYKNDFEVVEERQGNTTLYPHTDQLPVLSKQLQQEFYAPLPDRIRRVDKRGTGFNKIVLNLAGLTFCNMINASRSDHLCLYPLLDHDLVTRVSIVQKVTEHTTRGPLHEFRFFAGIEFFPTIFLSAKRIRFAKHVFDQYEKRVPCKPGTHLPFFLSYFFSHPIFSLSVNGGKAFVLPCLGSVMALPYQETSEEFIVLTCLSMNEINAMDLDSPVRLLYLHYEPHFSEPQTSNGTPDEWVGMLYNCWSQKKAYRRAPSLSPKSKWSIMAHRMIDHAKRLGHGPGSYLQFHGNILGPGVVEFDPKKKIGH